MLDRCSEERRPQWAGVLFCLVVVSGYRAGIEVLLAAACFLYCDDRQYCHDAGTYCHTRPHWTAGDPLRGHAASVPDQIRCHAWTVHRIPCLAASLASRFTCLAAHCMQRGPSTVP